MACLGRKTDVPSARWNAAVTRRQLGWGDPQRGSLGSIHDETNDGFAIRHREESLLRQLECCLKSETPMPPGRSLG